MINNYYKKYYDYLDEARRNPEMSSRGTSYQLIDQYVNDDSVFVRFTSIPKFGLYPQSTYLTPIGLYSYPLKTAQKVYGMSDGEIKFPFPIFSHDKQYITFFRAKSDANVVYMSTYNNLREDIQKLKDAYKDEADSVLKRAIKSSYTTENKKISWLWNITRQLASGNSVKWTHVLHSVLGYDGFVDDKAYGLIHENEKCQAVFFDISKLELITIHRNDSVHRKTPPAIGKMKSIKLKDIFNIIEGRKRSLDNYVIQRLVELAPQDFRPMVIDKIVSAMAGRLTIGITKTLLSHCSPEKVEGMVNHMIDTKGGLMTSYDISGLIGAYRNAGGANEQQIVDKIFHYVIPSLDYEKYEAFCQWVPEEQLVRYLPDIINKTPVSNLIDIIRMMKHQAFSDKYGIAETVIRRLERGKDNPNISIVQICIELIEESAEKEKVFNLPSLIRSLGLDDNLTIRKMILPFIPKSEIVSFVNSILNSDGVGINSYDADRFLNMLPPEHRYNTIIKIINDNPFGLTHYILLALFKNIPVAQRDLLISYLVDNIFSKNGVVIGADSYRILINNSTNPLALANKLLDVKMSMLDGYELESILTALSNEHRPEIAAKFISYKGLKITSHEISTVMYNCRSCPPDKVLTLINYIVDTSKDSINSPDISALFSKITLPPAEVERVVLKIFNYIVGARTLGSDDVSVILPRLNTPNIITDVIDRMLVNMGSVISSSAMSSILNCTAGEYRIGYVNKILDIKRESIDSNDVSVIMIYGGLSDIQKYEVVVKIYEYKKGKLDFPSICQLVRYIPSDKMIDFLNKLISTDKKELRSTAISNILSSGLTTEVIKSVAELLIDRCSPMAVSSIQYIMDCCSYYDDIVLKLIRSIGPNDPQLIEKIHSILHRVNNADKILPLVKVIIELYFNELGMDRINYIIFSYLKKADRQEADNFVDRIKKLKAPVVTEIFKYKQFYE